jgi:hypothetical protein
MRTSPKHPTACRTPCLGAGLLHTVHGPPQGRALNRGDPPGSPSSGIRACRRAARMDGRVCDAWWGGVGGAGQRQGPFT